MIRLGLCCQFAREPIGFHTATAAALARHGRAAARRRLAALCLANAEALCRALAFCAAHGIGAFRVNSQILPLRTHPRAGYRVADLPGGAAIVSAFRRCGVLARRAGLRLSFHPDQFIVLNSPDPAVVAAATAELEYQAEVAGWIGADVITLHAGGVYGDKPAALRRLRAVLDRLPAAVRRRLALENDDRHYAPADLLPLCRAAGVPLVYDAHHHRCRPDTLDAAAATAGALRTWDREPLLHLSSPRGGWRGGDVRPHADYIAPRDVPAAWLRQGRAVTVEVEAKAKELAVLRLRRWLAGRGAALWNPKGVSPYICANDREADI